MKKKTKTKKRSVARKATKRPVKRTVKRPAAKRKAVKKVVRKVASKKASYGVEFVRAKHITEIRGPSGWKKCPGKTRKSDRRFATKKEATQHGKRFTEIEGHKGFKVFVSKDKVNAKINWFTGKTNPIIGLGRTNR